MKLFYEQIKWWRVARCVCVCVILYRWNGVFVYVLVAALRHRDATAGRLHHQWRHSDDGRRLGALSVAGGCPPRSARQNHPLRPGHLAVVSVARPAAVGTAARRSLPAVRHTQRGTGSWRHRRSHDMQRRRYPRTGGLYFTRPLSRYYYPLRAGQSIYSPVRRFVYGQSRLYRAQGRGRRPHNFGFSLNCPSFSDARMQGSSHA